MASLKDQSSLFPYYKSYVYTTVTGQLLPEREADLRVHSSHPSLVSMSTYFNKHFKILHKMRTISLLTGKARGQLKNVFSLKVHISYMIRIKEKITNSANFQVCVYHKTDKHAPLKVQNLGPRFILRKETFLLPL